MSRNEEKEALQANCHSTIKTRNGSLVALFPGSPLGTRLLVGSIASVTGFSRGTLNLGKEVEL